MQQWDKAGYREAKISINVSYRELSNPNFYENVITKLSANNIAASRIAYEVLETVAINHNNHAILKNLNRLYDHGINLYVDDFGIGYSSVSSLQKSNFQKIKIDRTFVCDSKSSNKDKVLLKSIIGIAKSLHINNLIEGIETMEQMDLAKTYGCDQIQGYLISKPKSFDDITQWWESNQIWKMNSNTQEESTTFKTTTHTLSGTKQMEAQTKRPTP